jgi:predicted metal-binding protein
MIQFDQYIQMAKDLKMINARIISSDDIVFDIRAILKCRWGCEDFFKESIKCHTRNTLLEERIAMIKAYRSILLVPLP